MNDAQGGRAGQLQEQLREHGAGRRRLHLPADSGRVRILNFFKSGNWREDANFKKKSYISQARPQQAAADAPVVHEAAFGQVGVSLIGGSDLFLLLFVKNDRKASFLADLIVRNK